MIQHDPIPYYRRLERLQTVLARVGYRRSALYAQVAAGTFPAPLKLGRISAWDSEAIDAWIAEKAGH
jgi:prophage regulatory protein